MMLSCRPEQLDGWGLGEPGSSVPDASSRRGLLASVRVWGWQVLGTAGSVGLAPGPSITSHERRASRVATS